MKRKISLLGSTGSIGTQALDVVRMLNLEVVGLTANKNVDLVEKQAREFLPNIVAMYDKNSALDLKQRLKDTDIKVVSGIDGLCEVAALEQSELVLNSVVGMVGLKPTLSAIEAKKDIALANKETLVAGGSLVMSLAKEKGVNIYPVDSEHSAIFQCLQGKPTNKSLKRLILTASGGAFFGKTADELRNITPQQALKHPNWSMGAKITVDSATLMNKGLEIIEASWLFDMPVEKIDVVVHRESIIHSLIEYDDNSVIAQLGVPDMRIPIQYAITYPERFPSPVKQLNLAEICKLSFYEPDYKTFKCITACINAIKRGGIIPAVINGANEQAVELFLNNKISFLNIGELVMSAMDSQEFKNITCLDDILQADKKAREYVLLQVQ